MKKRFISLMVLLVLFTSLFPINSIVYATLSYSNYSSIPIDSYQSFRNAVINKAFNVDSDHGAQCWDGACILWIRLGSYLYTGNGYARGCWELMKNENAGNNFELISNYADVKRGDVVVFSELYPTGHIGFADADYSGNGYISLLAQNQGSNRTVVGYGDTCGQCWESAFNVTNKSVNSFLGAFRYKNWGGTSPQPHIYDDKNVAHPKEDVKFSYSGLTEASKVEICFQKNGKVYYSDDATKSRDYYTYFNYEGQYYVFVRGLYDNVWYESNKILVEITNPQFNVSKTDVEPYEQIVFSYENLTNANKVELCFEKDNSIYYTIDVTKDKKCTNFFENTGIYNTFVRAYYNGTPIESNKISIIVSQSYFINYDANGGSNAPATQKKSSSSALSLSSIEPTRNGYTFKNWNTKADGSGTSYQSGETYTTNADATLYAQWEKIISTQTKVTKKPTYSLINIAVENAEPGTNVIVAMYNQNRMVDFQTEVYTGNDISLATFSNYDKIKVMLWESLSTLKPLGNVEIIKN